MTKLWLHGNKIDKEWELELRKVIYKNSILNKQNNFDEYDDIHRKMDGMRGFTYNMVQEE